MSVHEGPSDTLLAHIFQEQSAESSHGKRNTASSASIGAADAPPHHHHNLQSVDSEALRRAHGRHEEGFQAFVLACQSEVPRLPLPWEEPKLSRKIVAKWKSYVERQTVNDVAEARHGNRMVEDRVECHQSLGPTESGLPEVPLNFNFHEAMLCFKGAIKEIHKFNTVLRRAFLSLDGSGCEGKGLDGGLIQRLNELEDELWLNLLVIVQLEKMEQSAKSRHWRERHGDHLRIQDLLRFVHWSLEALNSGVMFEVKSVVKKMEGFVNYDRAGAKRMVRRDWVVKNVANEAASAALLLPGCMPIVPAFIKRDL